jgi:type III restriction enzyme
VLAVPPVVIDNPILNSPFSEPTRHFRFSEDGITDQAVDGRRESGYFLPIASPRKKGGQLRFETEWTQDRFQSSPRINRIRERVALWRQGGYVGCTRMTERLLRYWSDPARERRLFFCQIEALETAIYLSEVASRYGDAWIENELRVAASATPSSSSRPASRSATDCGCCCRPTRRTTTASAIFCRRICSSAWARPRLSSRITTRSSSASAARPPGSPRAS